MRPPSRGSQIESTSILIAAETRHRSQGDENLERSCVGGTEGMLFAARVEISANDSTLRIV